MKKYGILAVILPILLLIVPIFRLSVEPSKPSAALSVVSEKESLKKTLSEETFAVLRAKEKRVETLSAQEYIIGVVAAEMPASYETEALKAQAVAAYTFACRRKVTNRAKAYDISDNCAVDQAYCSPEGQKKKWGKNAEKYRQKITAAVQAVWGETVLYQGEPALTVYHAISSGKTENAKEIWGGNVSYLTAVSSNADRLAKNYRKSKVFSPDELRQCLREQVRFSGKAEAYFKKAERTASGTVKTISVCGQKIAGSTVQKALGLRSANFQIAYKEGSFRVTTFGYGHGVGMSQNGANAMAKQGSDYREILCHYYSGCTVEKAEQSF